ncbi:hypothetical protein Celaphus_00017256 [Cervus elaphus hippelaphus]|uniref:ADP-ribosyl cyclase/cyclic ADP-ribose hydrolase n=1 Tax=Cervus elaphus hippelaphus TaxID=46360 RepID=A0A212D6A4_CEREH|nr:hypothetical protein Celaphus_00017256 [Cervus elaphus hippelaphus]
MYTSGLHVESGLDYQSCPTSEDCENNPVDSFWRSASVQVSTRATVNQGKRHFGQIFRYRESLELSRGWLPTKEFFFLSLLPASGSPRLT